VHHLWKLGVLTLIVAGAVFATYHFAPGSGPYAGTWKVVLLQPGVETTLCLIRVGGDESHPRVDLIDAPGFASAGIEDAHSAEGALRFHLKTERGDYQIVVYAPKGAGTVDRLLGSLRDKAFYDMVRLERTGLRELDLKKGSVQAPGFVELNKGLMQPRVKDQESAIERILKDHGDEPVAQYALLMLVQVQARAGASTEELRATGDRDLALAAAYGREIELQTAAQLARVLSQLPADRGGTLALDYGKRAEGLLKDEDPPLLAAGIFKTVARSLRAAGKESEAKETEGRAVALNAKLDEEFARNAIKFDPAPPQGRRSTSNRVVLAELFTGAQCPPCVAADIAFDAALQVYKPSQVVFLQYHEHVPRADPLTSAAGEVRLHYYSDIPGTPAFVLDGKLVDESIGGPIDRGERSYELLHAALDQAMETPAEARLNLTARREGDMIDLTADIADLSRPGERTRLRFVLVEDVVHYAAPNGQRLHHHVVRDFPGGVDGIALPEKTAKRSVKVNLGQVRAAQMQYLAQVAARQTFPDDEQPLELKNLKAVAFIQDDVSKQVLQAAQADMADAK
jgi:hypothetical protein